MYKRQHGFTIVELVTVIVVIGILAAITIVAYNGVQERARDTMRMQHINQISKAVILYELRHGDYIEEGSGCGRNGAGYGWFNSSNATDTYQRSILSCLIDAGFLNESVKDPVGPTAFSRDSPDGKYAYMKYNCVQDGRTTVYLFAKLEHPDEATVTPPSGMCAVAGTYITDYGMNYIVKVE